jgi:hypothetical protein
VFGDEVLHIPRWKTVVDFEEMDVWPSAWDQYSVFASGTADFCRVVVSKLGKHVGPYLYVIDMNFESMRPRNMDFVLSKSPPALQELGLESTEVAHADFGGVTTARHIIAHRNVAGSVFVPLQVLHRTLSHVVKTTVSGLAIDAPPPLDDDVGRRAPIVEDGMLRGEGLLEVCWQRPLIACKCVLNRSGWNALMRMISLWGCVRSSENLVVRRLGSRWNGVYPRWWARVWFGPCGPVATGGGLRT